MPFKKKGDQVINNDTGEVFTLTRDPSNQNAGKCMWATTTSNKTPGAIFVKQYLSPKGPSTMASPEENERRLKICEEFKKQKLEVFNIIKDTPHQHLLTPIALFQEKSTFFSAYPFKKEDKLADEIIDTISFDDKLNIMRQVTSAVVYLHKNKLIHSDIKPTNLIILSSPLHAYLIDYDSAYFNQKPPDEIEGDFVYRSPEMIRFNNKSARDPNLMTHASDIFSLGLLFYRILSNKLPPVQGDAAYVAQAIVNGVGYDLTLGASIDKRFEQLIKQMLHPLPIERPSALNVERELIKIISGKGSLGVQLYSSIMEKIKTIGDSKFWETCWEKTTDGYEIKNITNESKKKKLSEILAKYALSTEERSVLNDFEIKLDESYDLKERIGNSEGAKSINKSVKINMRKKKRW